MAGTKKSSLKKPVRILSSKVVYRGTVFQVTSDQIKEPEGAPVRRDIIRHSGSVVIMAVQEGAPARRRGAKKSAAEPQVLLARQYRYAANDYLWELPAGRIDEGEDELPAAKRELIEETGFIATRWKRVLHFFPSPGFLDETMALYLATGLTAGEAQPEDDEFIKKRFIPLPQALKWVLDGRIRDGKSIAGILWLREVTSRQRPLL